VRWFIEGRLQLNGDQVAITGAASASNAMISPLAV
jgi:hypothetical protein